MKNMYCCQPGSKYLPGLLEQSCGAIHTVPIKRRHGPDGRRVRVVCSTFERNQGLGGAPFHTDAASLSVAAFKWWGPRQSAKGNTGAARPLYAAPKAAAGGGTTLRPEVAKEEAETAYKRAATMLPEVELAKARAAELAAHAEAADRVAKEAEAHAEKLYPEAQEAVRELRLMAADIRGTEEEVSRQHLETLHLQMLEQWQQDHPHAQSFEVVARHETGISGVRGAALLIAYVAALELDGKRWALVSVAAAESVGEGQLEGLQLHWGGAANDGWGWEPPPQGWKSSPAESQEAGSNGQAFRTPFASYSPVFLGEPVSLMTAHACMLLLPVEGVIAAGGGLAFVLKRPHGVHPEWLQSSVHRDFYLSCKPVVDHYHLIDNPPVEEEEEEEDEEEEEGGEEEEGPEGPMAHGQEQARKEERRARKKARKEKEAAPPPPPPAAASGGYVTQLIAAIWGPKQEQHQLIGDSDMPEADLAARLAAQMAAQKGAVASGALDTPEAPLLSTWVPHSCNQGGGSLQQQLRSAVLLVDAALQRAVPAAASGGDSGGEDGPTARLEAMHSKADDVMVSARQLVEDAEACKQTAIAARAEAVRLGKEAADAQRTSEQLQRATEEAVHSARVAMCRVRGKEEEVAIADLHQVAAEQLMKQAEALNLHFVEEQQPREGEDASLRVQAVEPTVAVTRVFELDAQLVAHAVLVAEPGSGDGEDGKGGRYYALVALALGERFPSGALEGTAVHWGCVRQYGSKWMVPPEGWKAQPDRSFEAGKGAWQTPFSSAPAPGYEGRDDIDVHTAVLCLPLEEDGAVRGIDFVLKTPHAGWLARRQGDKRENFHADFRAAALAVKDAAQRRRAVEDARRAEEARLERERELARLLVLKEEREAAERAEAAERLEREREQQERELQEAESRARAHAAEQEQAGASSGLKELGAGSQGSSPPSSPSSRTGALPRPPSPPRSRSPPPTPIAAPYPGVAPSSSSSSRPSSVLDLDNLPSEQLLALLPDHLTGKVQLQPSSRNFKLLLVEEGSLCALSGRGVSDWMVEYIANQENKAERSLMHRFDIGSALVRQATESGGDVAMSLLAVTCWLRYASARHLTWNRNYNIKPREISAAQDKLTTSLAELYERQPALRDVCLLALTAVGSGGAGDAGQRIRDEILHVQQKNGAKGGMMEQWHQKLHNNTSPDDVVICEALIEYLKKDMDVSAYWAVLTSHGITRERLASYDRSITAEPDFKPGQKPGLLRDLRAYLLTLKAVHSGADLQAAAARVLGYEQTAVKGKAVKQQAVQGVKDTRVPALLEACLALKELNSRGDLRGPDAMVVYLETINEARHELRVLTSQGSAALGGRLRDLLYLDLALAAASRSLVESRLEVLRGGGDPRYGTSVLLAVARCMAEGAAMGTSGNAELVCSLEDLQAAQQGGLNSRDSWMLAAAAVDRLRRALGDLAEGYSGALQPTARALGARLGLPQEAVELFSEEVVRGTLLAPLSQLLAALDPALRDKTGAGSWSVVSPAGGRATGLLVAVRSLADVQHEQYVAGTVLLAARVGGEEEVPQGVVALLTGCSIDVLSHCAVRARNAGVLLATCYDDAALSAMEQECSGLLVEVTVRDGDVEVSPAAASSSWQQGGQSSGASWGGGGPDALGGAAPRLAPLKPKEWCGKFVISAEEFTPEVVGGKSMNTVAMVGKLPGWVKQPSSLAIPYATFERVLQDPCNVSVEFVKKRILQRGPPCEIEDLPRIRELILDLMPPRGFRAQFEEVCRATGIQHADWDSSWSCIKRVWASKWNDRALVSMAKAGLNHSGLSMAVLVQPVVEARYAFVAHTVNPLNGDKDELLFEMVQGFGETLVGNYPGSALRVTATKPAVAAALPPPRGTTRAAAADSSWAAAAGSHCRVENYPSKARAMVMPARCRGDLLIFRSDSNGEDLEGYAGAGLFDSVMGAEPRLVAARYGYDPLLTDEAFRAKTLGAVAGACVEVERVMGAAQDVEGLVQADGSVVVVQARPQV